MNERHVVRAMLLASALAVAATGAAAQTVKIGLLSTYSGPNAQYGENMERGMRLYMSATPASCRPASRWS